MAAKAKKKVRKQRELSSTQALVFETIKESVVSSCSLTLREIAERSGLSVSTVQYAIQSLERRGLIAKGEGSRSIEVKG